MEQAMPNRGGTSDEGDEANAAAAADGRRFRRGRHARRLRQRRQQRQRRARARAGKIAFLLPETQTARYETQDKPLFEQKVQELCPDCEILYQNADQDPTKQQSQVEAAVTEGVDVIVLDPVDSTSAAGMVTRAQQADIPVISYDRLILDADLAAYAEFNSSEVGKQQGDALAEALADDGNPTGPIVQINGDPKDNNAKLFKEGATAVFEDKGIDVAQEYDTPDWLPENAQKEMDQAITAVGKDGFHGVLAANDGTAGGAIAALKGAGIDPSTIPVTGQDAELAAIQRIIAGEQYMTVYKPIKPLADNAATLAVAVVNGEDPASPTSSTARRTTGPSRCRRRSRTRSPCSRTTSPTPSSRTATGPRRTSARSSTRRTARTQESSSPSGLA